MSIPAFQSLPFNTRQLAEQVPAWLTAASVAQRAHYRERLLAHLRSAARGASIHRRLLTPAQFCEPLLVQALVRRFNLEVDVYATEWVRVDYHYSLEGRRRQPHRQTLLEAAMGNFEAQEDFAPQTLILPVGEYRLVLGPVLGYRYDPRAVLPITPQAFAALCRELDMGGQYQAHLQAVLAPAPSSVLGAWPQDSIRRQIADALLVQVNCAQIKGAIDTSTAALLEALLGEGIAPSWQGGAVQVCRLRALVTWVHSGTPLAGAVLVRSQADPEGPCVLYLPGAEAEPLKQFDSFAAMAIALRQRLRDRGFQAFFQRFVPCAERGEFFARLLNTLSPQPFSLLFPKPREDDPDADIGVRADALATGLVEQLRLDMLATVLGDARWCVVPTDDEDRKTRDRRLQQMLALGLDVLNVAGFIVPSVGVLMAVVGVAQLLGETFVGVDDWTHGQKQEAVGHFFSVADNLALLAAGSAVHVAVERSPFVEGMLPVMDGQGRQRLWNVDLAAFSVADDLPADATANPQGQYQRGGQWYIRMDGKLYRQGYDAAKTAWFIEHPDGKGVRVPLRHNGQGAWRGAHELTHQWGARQAMRRLGPATFGLDDFSLDVARLASGLSEAQVQALHVRNRPLPALLLASLADFRAQAEVMGLPAPERAAAFAQRRDTWPAVAVNPGAMALNRDFPGLPPALADAVLATANTAERQYLQRTGRLPLRLAERAQGALRAWRLNRAITGLALPDSAWPQTRRLRKGLLSQAPDASPSVATLVRLAIENPTRAAQLIGQAPVSGRFRLPQRQPNGHWGYPLSGRPGGAGVPLRERLSELYPRVDDAELEALLAQLGEGPEQVGNFAAVQLQHQQLTADLDAWVGEQGGGLAEDVQREARIEAMERILAVWQRDPGHINYEDDQVSGYELDLSDLPLGQLPALTADFSHVQQLVLDGVGTNHDPSPFLRAFTSLRGVDMCRNGLLTIPEAVATLPMLRDLHLGANQLLASDDMFRSLAGLSSLESLDVQNMPLEIPPGAFAQLARLPSLRDLALSGTAQALSDQTLVGVASLSRLQYLWLRNTGLVMSAARGQLLAQLHDLRWMDLADNPLGESLDLSPFTRLISVDLSRCRLTGWPAGLTELMAAQPLYLNTVLLTQNPIAEVPVLRGLSMFAAGARNVPTLRISREALSEASLDRLLAVDVEPVEAHGQVLADWLQGSTAQVRLRAEALREQPEARFFMTALDRSVETQDYRADRQAGRVRIQQLLNALDDEPEGEAAVDRAALRNQLFDVGEEVMTTCGDGVQLFLRRCETLVQVYDVAQQAAADGDLGRLAQLGRRFYREHLLDEVAGRLYNARVTRRQVLFPDAVARAATAQELAALTPADEHGAPALAAMDEGDSASLVDAPDEAEIRLRLRIDLAQRLDLPPQAQHMRYFQAMSETIRERVTEAVNNADTPHARRAWILGQAWWVHCVQRHWQVRFQALREHWYAGHAYLLALQDADGELEPVPADVLRPLETFFPEHAWQREGVPQRVVLTEEESEAARQRLDSAQHEAERSLLEGLSAPVLGDDEAA